MASLHFAAMRQNCDSAIDVVVDTFPPDEGARHFSRLVSIDHGIHSRVTHVSVYTPVARQPSP